MSIIIRSPFVMRNQDFTKHLEHTTGDSVEGIFPDDSIGALLASGQQSWAMRGVTCCGVTVTVVRSDIGLKKQAAVLPGNAIDKVCIGIEIEFTHAAGKRSHRFEDLFPISTMDILNQPAAPDAMDRVAHAILETLKQVPIPLVQALETCLIPMKLYEPILDALMKPSGASSMAYFLQNELPNLLLDQVPFVAFEDDEHQIELSILDCQKKHSLRTPNALKLISKVRWQTKDAREDSTWKSRGMVLEGVPHMSHDAAPTHETSAQILAQWRMALNRVLEDIAQDGFQPIRLKKLLANAPLEDALQVD